MWQQVIAWIRLLWGTGEEVQRIRTEVKNLQAGERETHELIQVLATQNELLRKDNEMLRQQLQHERETREGDIRELKLELRLQIAEELRRLPPKE